MPLDELLELLVGDIFCCVGNLASLGGRYVYEADVNRTVAVHADAILAALQQVYGGTRVLAEIEASRRR